MKYSLFNSMKLPFKLTKVLSYLVMLVGIGVLIVGIVSKDSLPAGAQTPAPEQVQAAPAPSQSDAAVQAGTAGVIYGAAGAVAESPVPLAAGGAAQSAANGAEGADSALPMPTNAAPNPQNALANTAPDASSLNQPLDDRYNMGAETLNSTKTLIEQKKSNDPTNIFSRIMSILGIFGFIGIAWLFSNNKKKILWKLVAVGTSLQLLFAIFILWTPVGKAIFAWLNDAVTALLNFTNAGVSFLFSSYATGAVESPLINTAMSILPPIIFFSSLMTILYHLGIMQWIVRGMAYTMMRMMGTSGSESLSAVANIFVGMTEAPLVVKPYVSTMTESELFAIMSGGMATVAGGVMASYVAMLQPYFPDIAGHLIAASVMSAPATLVIAKIMIPETEKSETMGKCKLDKITNDANVIDAAARGAGEGMQLAINVAAMLLAFVALIALINFILGLPSRLVNANTYEHVAGYVASAGGKLDPECDKIYSSADTVACTHGALVTLAGMNGTAIPDDLKALSGDQGHKIDQTDALYDLVIADAETSLPMHRLAMVQDCQNQHSIAACSAVAAHTQMKSWTPKLEKKSVWPLISLESILGVIFFPIAFLMGVPLSDCFLVGQLLGEKMAVNEFVAYLHLSQVVDQLSYRGIVISTYALCGFANFGSIAIQIGGIGGMAPKRRSDIARLGIKAMIAGSIAAFMTATIAGALI